ncbi:Mechanosensitive ion channel [Desulfotomaculum arcticum]|uniref:Mechanosensitive ion channel n=1 Tax=Desulfotruncus arcticus DSM 17038 TaxID=1121424 RepID=A0A1I2SVN0_9FIRM|nr:mechanosensitive ion channel domain-containing protein [Desulfotruncus arcticus]SFG53981.1 Mechanosensitive ion channel [Desulfotomaculum arcticum] [Desulfotruncus arcticus DSM 17038]
MDVIREWYQLWQTYPYHNEINFMVFIPLFFVLRSWLVKKLNLYFNSKQENNDLSPFIQSLINWGTFYAIIVYAIIYFRDTLWLGETWFKIGDTPVTTLTFIVPAIIISLSIKFSNFISRFLLHRVYSRYEMDQGMQYTFSRLMHYGIIVVSILVALPVIGFDLSILTVFAGVAGIGIGFGMQNIISNFISGLIVLFERPIKVGDRIQLGDLHCDVEHINIRSTIVRTRNNEHIIIPNSQFIENQIMNWSYGDPKVRQEILIGVAYGSDVQLLERLLLQAAQEHEEVLDDPPPRVDFLNFGESSLDFRLLYWIPHPVLRTMIKSALNFRINDLLQEHGVEIPFPQRDLHLRSVDTLLLSNLQVEMEQKKELQAEN